MPSDDRRLRALTAMARERNAFRAAVAGALEQVRTLVISVGPSERAVARAAAQLGGFAAGRVDAARFGELFAAPSAVRIETVGALRYAQYLLKATLTLEDEAFFVSLAAGDDLRDAVVRDLSNLGRVFSAAHAVTSLRNASSEPKSQEPLLAPLTPDRWTRGERALAPPLVVELEGADLRAGGLGEVLQGAQKIVLLVNGAAPPAALVRLITPGVFVMQCREVSQLDAFSAYEGPAIAAVMGEGAEFVFDGARLELHSAPPKSPSRRLGRLTSFQQSAELQWLLQLAALTNALAHPPGSPPSNYGRVDPGDQLAAWLLKQAQL